LFPDIILKQGHPEKFIDFIIYYIALHKIYSDLFDYELCVCLV